MNFHLDLSLNPSGSAIKYFCCFEVLISRDPSSSAQPWDFSFFPLIIEEVPSFKRKSNYTIYEDLRILAIYPSETFLVEILKKMWIFFVSNDKING